MGEISIDPKFNIHETYKKVRILNPYRNSTPVPSSSWATVVADYTNRVELDGGIVEDSAQLQTELDTLTETAYYDALAYYNPNGGYKQGKIYDVRDVDNSTPNDLVFSGGGGTRFLADSTLEAVSLDKPKIDYSTGKAAFLIEPATNNFISYSYDLRQAALNNSPIITLDQVGITGLINTASRIEDNSSLLSEATYQPFLANTMLHYSVWIKKDQDETRFPEFYTRISTSNNPQRRQSVTQLNTKTGATFFRANIAEHDDFVVLDRGDWWVLVWKYNNTTLQNLLGNIIIRPAMTNGSIGTSQTSATGSIIVGYAGISEYTSMEQTPIISNGATVNRPISSASIITPSGVTSIEEKVNGTVNTITTIPTSYSMKEGATDYVIFR